MSKTEGLHYLRHPLATAFTSPPTQVPRSVAPDQRSALNGVTRVVWVSMQIRCKWQKLLCGTKYRPDMKMP